MSARRASSSLRAVRRASAAEAARRRASSTAGTRVFVEDALAERFVMGLRKRPPRVCRGCGRRAPTRGSHAPRRRTVARRAGQAPRSGRRIDSPPIPRARPAASGPARARAPASAGRPTRGRSDQVVWNGRDATALKPPRCARSRGANPLPHRPAPAVTIVVHQSRAVRRERAGLVQRQRDVLDVRVVGQRAEEEFHATTSSTRRRVSAPPGR